MKMELRQIKTIALNVVRETLRKRVFLILTGSGFFMFLLSHILGSMSVGGTIRVIQNAGFWVIGMWGLITALFLGANIIRDEIQKKTAYLILSRPVSRNVFLSGKFLGIVFVMVSLYISFVMVMLVQFYLSGINITTNHCIALAFIFLEWIVLASFSIFFASFTSPLLLGFFLSAIYFLGHWSKTLYILARNTEDVWIKKLLMGLYYVFPNLEAINFREAALYNDMIVFSVAIHGAVVALCWTFSMLAAAMFIFYHRKLL